MQEELINFCGAAKGTMPKPVFSFFIRVIGDVLDTLLGFAPIFENISVGGHKLSLVVANGLRFVLLVSSPFDFTDILFRDNG